MVNRKRNYTLHFYLMAVLTAIALGAINYLGMEHRARIDLTADKRFTLSEGTKALFEKLADPVTVTYYVDAEPPAKRINLERDVVDKLEELSETSGGKLEYRVERISNEDAAEKADELDDLGVEQTIDVQMSGDDERAAMRGIQGYFSSLEIRYGTAEPKVINGIINVVDADDEIREHRVDTLEFDIAYSILQMRNSVTRPTFGRMLKLIDEPVKIALLKTDGIPEEHAAAADRIDEALSELADTHPGQIELKRVPIDPDPANIWTMSRQGPVLVADHPFDEGTPVAVSPYARSAETQDVAYRVSEDQEITLDFPAQAYVAEVFVEIPDKDSPLSGRLRGLTELESKSAVKRRIEDELWEAFRPRTRLGVVLPPAETPQQPSRGGPPRTGHTALFQYLSSEQGLGYDAVQVDLAGDKRIPRDLVCLLVIEPNLLTERELYEIDRYLAEGGNVVMLVQAWNAELQLANESAGTVGLEKRPVEPHFEEWAENLGISFGQELLLRENAKLQPFVVENNRATVVPARVRLAPLVEPRDLNPESVFTRGIASLPLPLVVEMELSDERLSDNGLSMTELIRLKDDIYAYHPARPASPSIPRSFDVTSIREVEHEPNAERGEDVLAQRLGHDPLIAAHITGRFPHYWHEQGLHVPGWEGADPGEEVAPAVANASEGSLLVMSTAGMLNTDYFPGYQRNDLTTADGGLGPVLESGINFYRNAAEAYMYGDDLVNLRARSGATPRIVGPVTDQQKVFWFLVCIAGMPLVLLVLAGAGAYIRIREREDYESGLTTSKAS